MLGAVSMEAQWIVVNMNGIIVNDGKDRLRNDVLLGMTSSTNNSGFDAISS